MTVKRTVFRPKRDPARPVNEPLPHDVADTLRRAPQFQGRCYLCGSFCVGVFCHAHQWASK